MGNRQSDERRRFVIDENERSATMVFVMDMDGPRRVGEVHTEYADFVCAALNVAGAYEEFRKPITAQRMPRRSRR